MSRSIIVGIYNTGDKRIDEYTPVEDKRLGGGHADAYGRMLVEELKPFIDAQYRTLPGAENCGMGGSSLGGLVTLYLGYGTPPSSPGWLWFRPPSGGATGRFSRQLPHSPSGLSCASGWTLAPGNRPGRSRTHKRCAMD